MQLLRKLLAISSPSGNEGPMLDFLINYFNDNSTLFKQKPVLFYGDDFQDNLAVAFGTPRTAVFAHMDTVGFTVRYDRELVAIGGPHTETGLALKGTDKKGDIKCRLIVEDPDTNEALFYEFERLIDRGTELVFDTELQEEEEFIQSAYLDNRLGLWNALKLAETLENGLLVFTCREEHKGGSAGMMGKFMYKKFGIRQALISDITWITHGVHHSKGVVVSMRDSGLPRRKFLHKIISLAEESGIPFQLEVEDAGGSDGNELQKIPYPIDWIFVGAAESNVHSPRERVHKGDLNNMVEMYRYLMEKL